MTKGTDLGNARVWFDDLPPESIDSYDDLKKAFLENYLQQKKYIKDPIELHNIKQRDGDSTEDFVRRVARQRITHSFSPNPEIFFPPIGEDKGTKGPMIIEAEKEATVYTLNGAGLCWEVMEGREGVVRRWWSGAEIGRSGAMECGRNSGNCTVYSKKCGEE
nr:reverse transcriptase domain-containing protein [Tanacetum cinerariifolium]